jgi:branched-subunit amino acid aminotransferase/4-amino-4-deoxychorismate lyase
VTVISIDGEIVTDARISVLDRGLLYGDGLFEVFPSWADIEPHLDRLYTSAAALKLRLIDRGDLRAQIDRVRSRDQRVRVIVTRGAGGIGKRLGDLGPGHTIIIAEPVGVLPGEISVAVVDWPLPRRTTAAHKTLAYFDHAIARELAAEAGADEALRLDADRNVAECATANIFMVRNSCVVTPPVAGILPGVTRARVLAWCRDNGVTAVEQTISRDDVAAADELFATSAVRGVVAITRLDGQPRAGGPITRRIADAINARPAI